MKTQPYLTRYLYIHDEVKYSLLLSLLDKNDVNISLFWGYELYFSGFQEELFQLLFSIYFDFYSLSNPKFYNNVLLKYYLEWSSTKNHEYVGVLIKNMFCLLYTSDAADE